MIKKIIFYLLFFAAISIHSQKEQINNYKYVIVPEQFDFLKKSDQYQTSSLTKFLLQKKGFIVFLSNEKLPKDLLINRCLGLTANVIDESSMFYTKNKIEIKDCMNNVLYTSKLGRSKEKEFKKAYHQTIRNAYATMTDLHYKYKPKKEDVVLKEKEISTNINLPIKKNNTPVKIVPEIKTISPVKINTSNKELVKNTNLETLYAQEIPNGFQLVNTKPSIVFQVLKTKVKDVFIIKDKNGILYKNAISWFAEYYEKGNLIVKKYNIKF